MTATHSPGRRAVLRGAALAAVAAPAALTALASAAEATGPLPEQYPVTGDVVDVPGGSLFYWDTGGTGSPVVLDHTATGSALAWPFQQPALVGAGHRVIAYSRRGYYRSSAPTPDDPPAADDLLALVDHLGLRKFDLIGAALGGFVAMDFALSHPERLRSLVIANSQMGIQEPEFRATLARLQPTGFNAMPHSFLELGGPYRAADPDGVARWEQLAALSRPEGLPLPKLANNITWALLEKMTVRTLLTAGEGDLYLPIPLTRTVLGHLPDARLVIFSEAGHTPHWERPDAFNRWILQFLAGARFPRESRG
ncbi:alpha/beta hydrolase [Amycolatopsis sp. NPDC021455]|uniref:alpha/beta fold hydrolase n=1 Tax=Amycolatopsis sp. NPDC021455 TaxID=3154901 RepID=UPI0033C4EAF5